MKRFISIICIFSFVILSCSCREKEVSPWDILARVEGCFDTPLPACRTVFSLTADRYSKEYLTPSLASLLYYGEKRDELYELTLLSYCIIRLADGESGAEIHILKSKAASYCDTLEKMLRRRLDYIKGRALHIYSPENYEKYASSARVWRKGKYLFLLATQDNERAIKAIEKLI